MHKSLHTKSVPRKSHALQDLCITTICIMRMLTVMVISPMCQNQNFSRHVTHNMAFQIDQNGTVQSQKKLRPQSSTPPNPVCSSHPPMFFLEGTISYWQPSPLNILYHWQWWQQSTMMVGSLCQRHFLWFSLVLHAQWACWLARCHANHPCTWCWPHHHLQGIAPRKHL